MASVIATHPTEDLAFVKITKPYDVNFSYLKISSNQEEIGNWAFFLVEDQLYRPPICFTFPRQDHGILGEHHI